MQPTRSLARSISPGPMKLIDMVDPAKQAAMSWTDSAKLAREKELERFNLFPMYPTGNHSSYFLLDPDPCPPTRSFPPCRQPCTRKSKVKLPTSNNTSAQRPPVPVRASVSVLSCSLQVGLGLRQRVISLRGHCLEMQVWRRFPQVVLDRKLTRLRKNQDQDQVSSDYWVDLSDRPCSPPHQRQGYLNLYSCTRSSPSFRLRITRMSPVFLWFVWSSSPASPLYLYIKTNCKLRQCIRLWASSLDRASDTWSEGIPTKIGFVRGTSYTRGFDKY